MTTFTWQQFTQVWIRTLWYLWLIGLICLLMAFYLERKEMSDLDFELTEVDDEDE